MAGEIGSAFVRIRPNTAGFREETEHSVRGALRDVGRIVAEATAVAGGIDLFKTAVEDAAREQTALAGVRHSIEQVGASWNVNGRTVEAVLQRMKLASGATIPELAAGLQRLIPVSGSTAAALKDLAEAEDVAHARHIELSQAATVLARAEAGSDLALRRLGVIIPAVTAHARELVREHNAAVISGIRFTAAQNASYQTALKQAKALDTQTSHTKLLAEVQRRFGGQTAVFAQTAEGQYARFQAVLHNLLGDIGEGLLPGLLAAGERARNFVEDLRASGEVEHAVDVGVRTLSSGFNILGSVLDAIAPPLERAVHLLEAVVNVAGVGGLLAFAAGFKAIGAAVEIRTAALRRYNAVLAAGRGEKRAAEDSAATVQAKTHTAALSENAAAAARSGASLEQRGAVLGQAIPREQVAAGAVSELTVALERQIAVLVADAEAIQAHAAATARIAETRAAGFGATAVGAPAASRGAAEAAVAGTEAQTGALNQNTAALQTNAGALNGRDAALAGTTTASEAAVGATSTLDAALEREAASLAATIAGLDAATLSAGRLATALDAAGASATVAAGQTAAVAEAEGAAATATVAVEGETAAFGVLSGSVEANTAVLGANTAATEANAVAKAALGNAAAASGIKQAAANEAAAAGVVGRAGQQAAAGGAATAASLARTTGEIEAASGAAVTASARFATLGRGLFALAGGWTTVAAVGIGAAAFGIYKLITAEEELDRKTDHLKDTVSGLGTSMTQVERSARDLASAVERVRTDRLEVDAARTAVAQAKQALEMSNAGRGSIEYAQKLQALGQAQNRYRQSLSNLARDQNSVSAAEVSHARASVAADERRQKTLRETAGILAQIRKDTQGTITIGTDFGAVTVPKLDVAKRALEEFRSVMQAAIKESGNFTLATQNREVLAFANALNRVPTLRTIRLVLNAGGARAGLAALIRDFERGAPSQQQFIRTLDQMSERLRATNPDLAAKLNLLGDYSDAIGRVPTAHETTLALKAPNVLDALKTLQGFLKDMDGQARTHGFTGGKEWAEAFHRGELAGPHSSTLVQELLAQIRALKAAAGDAAASVGDVAQSLINNATVQVSAAQNTSRRSAQAVSQAAETAQSAARDVADANRAVADAIREGNDAVRNAVMQAEQNLFSIGSSLEDQIDQLIDAQKHTDRVVLTAAQRREVAKIREAIKRGDDTDDIRRRSQALATQIQAQADAGTRDSDNDKRKTRIHRQINDLIDEFNKGAITLQQFTKGIADILKREHLSFRAAGTVLGVAFADGFRASIKGLLDQAKAISAGPRIRGLTGQEPSIVRPLDALRDSQRAIGDAQRRRDDARHAQLKAAHDLQVKQEEHERDLKNLTRQRQNLDRLNQQHLAYLTRQAETAAARRARHREHMAFQRRIAIAVEQLAGARHHGEDEPGGLPPRRRPPAGGRASRDARISGTRGLR